MVCLSLDYVRELLLAIKILISLSLTVVSLKIVKQHTEDVYVGVELNFYAIFYIELLNVINIQLYIKL